MGLFSSIDFPEYLMLYLGWNITCSYIYIAGWLFNEIFNYLLPKAQLGDIDAHASTGNPKNLTVGLG